MSIAKRLLRSHRFRMLVLALAILCAMQIFGDPDWDGETQLHRGQARIERVLFGADPNLSDQLVKWNADELVIATYPAVSERVRLRVEGMANLLAAETGVRLRVTDAFSRWSLARLGGAIESAAFGAIAGIPPDRQFDLIVVSYEGIADLSRYEPLFSRLGVAKDAPELAKLFAPGRSDCSAVTFDRLKDGRGELTLGFILVGANVSQDRLDSCLMIYGARSMVKPRAALRAADDATRRSRYLGGERLPGSVFSEISPGAMFRSIARVDRQILRAAYLPEIASGATLEEFRRVLAESPFYVKQQ